MDNIWATLVASQYKAKSTNPIDAMTAFLKAIRADRFENDSRMAESVGISLTAMTRALKGEQGLSNENLLRLAQVLGLSADEVLREVGRAEIADLFLKSYGDPAGTEEERKLLAGWRGLAPEAQRAVMIAVRYMARGPSPRSRRPGDARRGGGGS